MFSFSIFILAWESSDSDCCWDEEKKYHWQFAAFYLCTLICAPIHTRRFKTVRLVVLHFIHVFHDIECASDIYRLVLFYQSKQICSNWIYLIFLVKLWNCQCLWPFYFATVATLLTSFEFVGFIPLETSIDETMKFRTARAFWKLLCAWTIEIVSM